MLGRIGGVGGYDNGERCSQDPEGGGGDLVLKKPWRARKRAGAKAMVASRATGARKEHHLGNLIQTLESLASQLCTQGHLFSWFGVPFA